MLIAARNGIIGNGLPYDREVEYLDSGDCFSGDNYNTASIYIITKVSYKPSISLNLKIWYGNNDTGCYTHGIVWQNSNSTTFRWCAPRQGTKLQFFTGTDTSKSISNVSISTWHDIIITQNILQCDTEKTISTAAPFTPDVDVDVALFARRQIVPALLIDNYAYAHKNVRIASAKMYDGTVLIRDFIPVRKGHVGYMYDKVSKRLFGNSGTGSFILGPDKVGGGGIIS